MKCGGCSQDFCLADMNKHHKELNEQLSQTENRYNQLKNTFEEQHIKIPKQTLIKQIDDWEKESLDKVRYVANRVRRQLLSRIEDSTAGLNLELKRLTEQLNQCRKEDDFVDKDVQFFDEQFKRLKTLLDTLPDCKLAFRSTSFINEIHLNGGGKSSSCFRPCFREYFSAVTAKCVSQTRCDMDSERGHCRRRQPAR